MGDLEQYYYKLNVTLLSIIGLWPGESTILQRIQKAGCSFILTFSLITQLTPFITMDYPPALVLRNIPMMIVATGSILKYFTFLFQNNDFKEIMELVKHDWSATTDDEESKILMHYANVGKFQTTTCAKLLYTTVTLMLSVQYASGFLDLVAPLNETRSPQHIVMFEAFVDKEKYFYLFSFITNVAVFTLCTVYIATESVYAMWQQHQASQFEIYAYRIRKAFLGDSAKMHILDRNARMDKIFGTALDMHDRANLFGVYLRKFWWSYVILLVLGVITLSVTLYRFSKTLETLDHLDDLIICAVVMALVFGYLFYVNYLMQQVINSYGNVSAAIYNTNWYAAPVHGQRMLFFAMLRNTQALKTTLYGISDASMEGFLVQAKVTFSYFLTIHSIQ